MKCSVFSRKRRLKSNKNFTNSSLLKNERSGFTEMSRKTKKFIEEFITPIVIALVVLLSVYYTIISTQLNIQQVIGFFLGLVLGQIVVYLYALSSITGKYKIFLHYYSLFSIVAVTFILAFISKYLAFGYFAGYSIIISFGFSLYALLKHIKTNL